MTDESKISTSALIFASSTFEADKPLSEVRDSAINDKAKDATAFMAKIEKIGVIGCAPVMNVSGGADGGAVTAFRSFLSLASAFPENITNTAGDRRAAITNIGRTRFVTENTKLRERAALREKEGI